MVRLCLSAASEPITPHHDGLIEEVPKPCPLRLRGHPLIMVAKPIRHDLEGLLMVLFLEVRNQHHGGFVIKNDLIVLAFSNWGLFFILVEALGGLFVVLHILLCLLNELFIFVSLFCKLLDVSFDLVDVLLEVLDFGNVNLVPSLDLSHLVLL